MPKIEIAVKELPPETRAYLAKTGSFHQMAPAMGELFALVGRLGAIPAGPPLGVYYNSPEEVPEEELSWEVAISVEGASAGEAVKALPERQVAATLHKGSYRKLGEVYTALFRWIGEQGYQVAGPPEEIYLTDPSEVSEEEYLTEVRVPVVKA